MSEGVSNSEFYMWRTIFALAHADNIVTDDEVRYMAEAMEDVPFSEEQKAVLREDIATPQDPVTMFRGISEVKDQRDFFKYAHEMVMADGDYAEEEQEVMIKLQQIHMRRTNVDEMVGEVKLQLEGDNPFERKSKKDVVFSFREQFLRDHGGED